MPPFVTVKVRPAPGPMSASSQLGGCGTGQIIGALIIRLVIQKSDGLSLPLELGLLVITRYPGNCDHFACLGLAVTGSCNCIITEKPQLFELPPGSRAVQVTVVVPNG